MMISALDLFSIGIGPSSSHTVGPMRAAALFAGGLPEDADRVEVTLHGSLASTGRGHGTDRAVVLGLGGHKPETVAADEPPAPGTRIPIEGEVTGPAISPGRRMRYQLAFDINRLPAHPNGMTLVARDAAGEVIAEEDWYSVGGGFVLPGAEIRAREALTSGAASAARPAQVPWPFTTGEGLLAACRESGMPVSAVVAANEGAIHGDRDVVKHLDRVWRTMRDCVAAGIAAEGVLPGGLGVRRRAHAMRERLDDAPAGPSPAHGPGHSLSAMGWVNLWALAVNEQNAAGGRVVTAPTNGAAGIIPAVMHYAARFEEGFDDAAARRFLLTSAAVGVIIKSNASISGAEVGCQGEVGSACAMAAAGLAEFLGGEPWMVERAAEIGLEHNLGLTCDPVGGLVQVPCIERNAMAAVKAINAAQLALHSTGEHLVSLDTVVRTMAETGRDMLDKYKETAAGGLAVNLTAC